MITSFEAIRPTFPKIAYCGQKVGWIKVPLDTEVGLDKAMLDGYPAPPRKGAH